MRYGLALLTLLSLAGCSEGPYEVNDEFKQQFINLKVGETLEDDAELLLGRYHIFQRAEVNTRGPALDDLDRLDEIPTTPHWGRGWRIVDSEGNKYVYMVSTTPPFVGIKRDQPRIEAKKFFDLSAAYDREQWEGMYQEWEDVETGEKLREP